MQGSAELANDVFGTGVRIGMPAQNIGGLSDSVEAPRFATVTGLGQYAAHRLALGASASGARMLQLSGGGMDRLVQRIRHYLQDFF